MEFEGIEFSLKEKFVDGYKRKRVSWGPLGSFVFHRTYARQLEDGSFERWWQTVRRVVEGCYLIQKRHCKQQFVLWDERQAQKSAQAMYDAIFSFKFLPPGRGLWAMGTEFMFKHGGTCLNNCGFVSTEDLAHDFSGPFTWLAEMSMLGVGVGFDTEGAFGKEILLRAPRIAAGENFVVEDSRQGWVAAFRRVLDAFVGKDTLPESWDFTAIRPPGSPIKGFGGVAPGPEPLGKLISRSLQILEEYVKEDKPVDSRLIVDLMNFAGAAVVAGGVRRSAEIAVGRPDDLEYVGLKTSETVESPDLARWASNNSVFAKVGMDYAALAEKSALVGEPGYIWLENARAFGRTGDGVTNADRRARGTNPCQPGWATVLTPEGIRIFDDIEVGSSIWTGRRWATVSQKVATGLKEVFRYHTTSCSFVGTPEHRVVSESRKLPVADALSLTLCSGPQVSGAAMDPRDIMDGLVLGDGTVHRASGDLILLNIGEDDADYHDSEVAPLILRERLGINKKCWEIETSIDANELPRTYDRRVPDRFYFGDTNKRVAFLRGLFSANGSVVRSRITLKQTSRELILQVRDMLSSLGIASYLTVNAAHDVQHANGLYRSRKSYDLNILRDSRKFMELIGFIQEYKVCKAERQISRREGRVKSSFDIKEVESCGFHPVYDITVDDPDHTYWTGGALVSNCGEQTLESYETCCLVETFPSLHASLDEYKHTLKYAYLYAKSVTLMPTHDPRTNAVMFRNRRIGLSQTGIIENVNRVGLREHLRWCEEGYKEVRRWDDVYSDWLCIPRSIKVTTVKPSGTVSLLPGVTPGIHFPHSEHYIRRIRVSKNSDVWQHYQKAGYGVVTDVYADNTIVIEFPVKENNFTRGKDDVSMWEQFALAAALQRHWSDNAVSITVTIQPDEAKDLANALSVYESQLKSVSFLPVRGDQVYQLAPYESITAEQYKQRISNLRPINFDAVEDIDKKEERFCDGEICTL